MPQMISLPAEVRALQERWELPYADEVRRAVRFNSRLEGDMLLHNLSGGGGTIMGHRLEGEELRTYRAAMDCEYLRCEHPARFDRLRDFLAAKGLDLQLPSDVAWDGKALAQDVLVPDEVMVLTERIYSVLPPHHFGHSHFRVLKLGGWGSGAAKCSEYQDPIVHMFSFATRGARRNYTALLLHETGHSHAAVLRERGLLSDLFDCGQSFRTPFSVDYLLGRTERFSRMMEDEREFAAEGYLLYVSQGEVLRQFVRGLPERERGAWMRWYSIFRQSFEDREYL